MTRWTSIAGGVVAAGLLLPAVGDARPKPDAAAIQGEATSKARIAAAEAELQMRRAEAYEQGETRKRVAEAAVEEAQNRALAKAALAEAERVEAEFDVVFVIMLCDGMFPSSRSTEDEEAIEEERRLFYVALTRARRTLILTRSAFTDGGRPRQRSPFLGVLGDTLVPATD